MTKILLEAKQLNKDFPIRGNMLAREKMIIAVDHVDIVVEYDESVGIVGESGSGKSTLARLLMQMVKPTSGEIFLDGQMIRDGRLPSGESVYSKMQMVFQEPFASISPRMKIGEFLTSTLYNHKKANKRDAREKAAEYLNMVDLSEDFLDRFPHQLSGGQLQRVMIARAISAEPKLILFDEATSALDASVQMQVLELLMELKRKLGLTYVFIGHDLAMVRSVTNRILVMHQGKIVERLSSDTLMTEAQNPYTKKLLDSASFDEEKFFTEA